MLMAIDPRIKPDAIHLITHFSFTRKTLLVADI